MLNVHCGTTILVLCFLATMLDRARSEPKEDLLRKVFEDLVGLATSQAYHAGSDGLVIHLEGVGSLTVAPSGNVLALQDLVCEFHKNIGESWAAQWNSMVGARGLTTAWSSDELPLLDVVIFTLTVMKSRRKQAKRPWIGKTFMLLKSLRAGLMRLLESVMLKSVVAHMTHTDVYNAPVPSRQLVRRRGAKLTVRSCCIVSFHFVTAAAKETQASSVMLESYGRPKASDR